MIKGIKTLHNETAIIIGSVPMEIYKKIIEEKQMSELEKIRALAAYIDEKTDIDILERFITIIHLCGYSQNEFLYEMRTIGLALIERLKWKV